MGFGRLGSICFMCDMIIFLILFMFIFKCFILNGMFVCVRRDGFMFLGFEREIIMLVIFVVWCILMVFIWFCVYFIKDLIRVVCDSVGGVVKSCMDLCVIS